MQRAPNWYAVYTAPRHEKKVREHFEVRQIESFLPLYESVRRWKNGCKMRIAQPLFPGYIFARMARSERMRILQVPGVVSLVGAGTEPIPLPDFQIESLRSGLHLRTVEPHPYLVVGDRARIKSGALAGMEGVLLRRKNSWRIVLSLDLIMQSVAVEVDVDDVEPAGTRGRPTYR